MDHLTETSAAGAPRLVLHADTTPANVHDAMRTEAIPTALATKGLVPAEHLVDAAYVSAEYLVAARKRHGTDLIGPARPVQNWQTQENGALLITGFAVDWERRRVRCPEGRESTGWGAYRNATSGRPCIRANFTPMGCQPCPARARCTRSRSRRLTLHPRDQHEAITVARARPTSGAGQRPYAQRQGLESTISQAVRAFGLRRARHCGLGRTGLQGVATAAAINLDRFAAWLSSQPLAPIRTSRFAALTTGP